MAKFRTGQAITSILIDLMTAAANDSYGASIMQRTGLPSGQLYPALSRLLRFGHLSETWETALPPGEARPLRRYHTLTA